MGLTENSSRRTMASFGVIYGADHLVLYVEPNTSLHQVHADTGRGRILIDNRDLEEGGFGSAGARNFVFLHAE